MSNLPPPPISDRRDHSPSLWRSFQKQRSVIKALMLRQVIDRYGHENLGLFWLMGEPLLLTLGVMLMWTLIGLHHGDGIGIVPFALTGYTMLTLWRHVIGLMIRALSQNASLLYHRNVRFIDILISRVVLEAVGGLSAFFIAYVPFYLLGYVGAIEDPLLFVGGWVLMALFSFSFGLVLAGLSELSDVAERFIQPLMYLTLPITGMFYMVAWLPPAAQKLVVWSPMVSCFEMFRAGLFGSVVQTYWDAQYVLIWCLALIAIGLPLISYAQKHIEME